MSTGNWEDNVDLRHKLELSVFTGASIGESATRSLNFEQTPMFFLLELRLAPKRAVAGAKRHTIYCTHFGPLYKAFCTGLIKLTR